MTLILISGPPAEPVEVGEAKEHLAVTHDQHNDMIARLIKAGRAQIEKYTGRKFIDQTWRYQSDCFPRRYPYDLEIPLPPCIAVTSFSYFNTNDTETDLVEDTDYRFITGGHYNVARVRPVDYWPVLSSEIPEAVRLEFRAGYTPSEDGSPTDYAGNVPDEVKQAILMYVGHYYNNRDQVILTQSRDVIQPLPLGAEDMVADLKIHYFA